MLSMAFQWCCYECYYKIRFKRFSWYRFEFLRNENLDARNFFDAEKGVFRRNQFGYAMGGPAIKDRLFWYTDYQGTRETRGISTGLVTLPTTSMREGDFSGVADTFVDADEIPRQLKDLGGLRLCRPVWDIP